MNDVLSSATGPCRPAVKHRALAIPVLCGVPWDPFGQQLNQIQPIPGTGFYLVTIRSLVGALSSVIHGDSSWIPFQYVYVLGSPHSSFHMVSQMAHSIICPFQNSLNLGIPPILFPMTLYSFSSLRIIEASSCSRWGLTQTPRTRQCIAKERVWDTQYWIALSNSPEAQGSMEEEVGRL